MFKDGVLIDFLIYFFKEFLLIFVLLNFYVIDIRGGYVIEILYVNVMLWFIIFVICERVDILILVGIDMLKDIKWMKWRN